MFSRSAWEPRWKYQAGRRVLCVNAAAEAALAGSWFDTPQADLPLMISEDTELDIGAIVAMVLPEQKAGDLPVALPKPKRGRPRKGR